MGRICSCSSSDSSDKEYFIGRQSRQKNREKHVGALSDLFVIFLCRPPLMLSPPTACGCPKQTQTCNPYKVAKGAETLLMPSGSNPVSHSYQCCCFRLFASHFPAAIWPLLWPHGFQVMKQC